ncbi:translation elongation factor 4 [Synechococcus sp. PCC 7336]|uniref:translation elongation factor 4 n=1 Tax=Synechococcus sp. PCC 7336 TaxID=195250 RepID=UPI0003496C03|nr:translation elongation factor 4 [Synechococcus sp. PCC 7336]
MTDVPVSRIRNFSIIAHIDHGKSTLADRLLLATEAISERDMKDQFLDTMDIERERGITIKLQAARLNYTAKDGRDYILNLIDTPGHVDFTYEVSRSLAACEGALLVVDASQGVEAQTLANVYLAIENDLEIIPVLNKIDLPGADPDRVIAEIEEIVGLDCTDAIYASAKEGIGIDEILEAIVKRIPPPQDTVNDALQALIFDSYYDPYRGVIVYFRVMAGVLDAKEKVHFMASGRDFELDELGVLTPKEKQVGDLHAGEVGYLSAAIKTVEDARVGDTITLATAKASKPLPGYVEAKPMVFCGLFPTSTDQFPELREALEKLKLNDAALQYEPETSGAMGFGFRCGFLGLLHMEIVQERLEREYDLDLIVTAPSVIYRVTLNDESVVEIDNPTQLPAPNERLKIEEPIVKVEIIIPEEFVGAMMELCETRRGEFKDMRYLAQGRTTLVYELPLAEVVTDFFDRLKSRSRGYASMDYHLHGYQEDKLVRLDVLINGEIVDALSCIVHTDKAYYVGKALVSKLRELIPRHQFVVPIQAAIGSKIVARETIPALRKNVLAKCYGGDVSRKRKLLEKQKAGKKRMKSVGTVDVPQSAFMAILSLDDSK